MCLDNKIKVVMYNNKRSKNKQKDQNMKLKMSNSQKLM